MDIWHVWTVRGGKVVRGQAFTSREQALEAAGVRELRLASTGGNAQTR